MLCKKPDAVALAPNINTSCNNKGGCIGAYDSTSTLTTGQTTNGGCSANPISSDTFNIACAI